MKELISIQIGGYANFVGSHFWNLQVNYIENLLFQFFLRDCFNRKTQLRFLYNFDRWLTISTEKMT